MTKQFTLRTSSKILLALFLLGFGMYGCEVKQEQVSYLALAKAEKIELLNKKFGSFMARMDLLEEKIKNKKALLEKMQKWPDRNQEQEEIIERLIEELEEDLAELKKKSEALGKEAKVVKGNNSKAALQLIDKNFREEIERLLRFKKDLLKKNGPGAVILAGQMDDTIRDLEDLLRKAKKEVEAEEM